MQFKKVTSSTDNIFGNKKYRIVRLRLVAAAAAETAICFDGAQSGGTDFCMLSATAYGTDKESFGKDDAAVLTNDFSVTLGGAGAILYVYYA